MNRSRTPSDALQQDDRNLLNKLKASRSRFAPYMRHLLRARDSVAGAFRQHPQRAPFEELDAFRGLPLTESAQLSPGPTPS